MTSSACMPPSEQPITTISYGRCGAAVSGLSRTGSHQREVMGSPLAPLRGERVAPQAPGEGRSGRNGTSGAPHPPLRGTFSPQAGRRTSEPRSSHPPIQPLLRVDLVVAIGHRGVADRLLLAQAEDAEHLQRLQEKLVYAVLQRVVEVDEHVAADDDV